MAIDGGMRGKLVAGTELTATYKGKQYMAEVVAGEDGKLRFRLDDGREFKSPSAAASAVMNGIAANGWRWWSIEGTQAATSATKPTVAPKQPAVKARAPRRATAKRRPARAKQEPAPADPDGIERVPID